MTGSFDRTANTKRNIIWGVFGRMVIVVGPFITRSFLIYNLGADYLGISSLYTSILQVLSLAELGFATAVAYSMYEPISKGDVQEVAGYLNYFRRIYKLVGLAILVVGLALMPFLGLFVEGDWPPDVNMQLAFAIYLGNTVLSYFMFAYKQTLLNAYQRNDVVNKVNIVIMTVQYLAQIAVLIAWPNFYSYAVVMPVCTVLSNCAISIVTDKLLPEYCEKKLKQITIDAGTRKDLHKRVGGLLFQQVCAVTRNSVDNIVISTFIGLTAVASYSNYFMIMSSVLGVLGTIGTSMTAAVGNSVAIEGKEKNFNDLRLFMFLYAMISIVAAACLVCLYQPFMMLWVGADLMLPFIVVVLFAVYFYVCTIGDIRSVYVNATGIWWELRWRALAETIVNVVLNLVLIHVIGLPGVILSTITSLFFINFIYGSHLLFKYYFGLDYVKKYYIDHAVYLLIAVFVCAATYLLVSNIPGETLLALIIRGLATVACSSMMLILVFMRTKRFKQATRFLTGAGR